MGSELQLSAWSGAGSGHRGDVKQRHCLLGGTHVQPERARAALLPQTSDTRRKARERAAAGRCPSPALHIHTVLCGCVSPVGR